MKLNNISATIVKHEILSDFQSYKEAYLSFVDNEIIISSYGSGNIQDDDGHSQIRYNMTVDVDYDKEYNIYDSFELTLSIDKDFNSNLSDDDCDFTIVKDDEYYNLLKLINTIISYENLNLANNSNHKLINKNFKI